MEVTHNDIVNALAKAEDVAYLNAQSRSNELSNGCKPSKADNDKAIEIESWIQLLTRAKDNTNEDTCLEDDIIWEIIQNVNELYREVDCTVSRTYSRSSSSGGGGNVPSGYVERVLGVNVDNSNPSRPIIEIFVDGVTITGDGTQANPFVAVAGLGTVVSVNGFSGAVTLTTANIPENTNLYYTNSRGIGSILTGLSISGGVVVATDSILQAIGKLQNQINGAMTNPMTTGGDIIYGGASGVPTRLANGTAGQILQSNGTTLAPSWATITAGNASITPITVTSLQNLRSTSALSTTTLYNVTDAVGSTLVLQVYAIASNTNVVYAIDVATGAIGTYNITTDAFIVAVPDLQQVTTAGATTTVGLNVDNGAGDSINIKHDEININNALGNATITSPTLTTATEFQLPDKAGPTETFAMLSDVTSLVTSVTAGTNISITGTSTAPIINSLADRYKTSSLTSVLIGNGAKTFTVDANLAYIPLQEVLIVNSPSNHMHATVTSYSGTTLVVDVKTHTGSGTYATWVINLDGVPIDAITGAGTSNQIAYFTSGQVIASLDTATYPSLTELSRVKGVGSQVVGTTDTNTLTNKRITARAGTVVSAATPTINTDNVDFFSITGQLVDITNMSTNLTGTPTDGQTLWIAITGTAARAINWGTSFEASTIALPTTTVTTARLDVAFIYNTVSSKWRCVGTC